MTAVTVATITTCVVLTNKPKKEEIKNITLTEKVEEEPKIFPLEAKSKQEVMNIYENRGTSDQSTLQVFCDYLNEKGSDLKEDQKVYLAYYWVKHNIVYDYEGRDDGTYTVLPHLVFPKRKKNLQVIHYYL